MGLGGQQYACLLLSHASTPCLPSVLQHTWTHTYMDTYIHAHTRTHTYTHTHTRTHTYTHAHIHARTHTCTHNTYTHNTYTHTYIHAHIHTSVWLGACFAPSAQGPIFSPGFQLPRTWPSLDTTSCEPERHTIGNGGPGSWVPAWQCPIHERPRPFVPLGMGSGLGPGPGLCAGETPQETGLAKWPPFPFSSLGHECAVSLPEAAQGGRPPCRALSAPGWCPQTLRGQGWAGACWESRWPVCVCACMGRVGEQSRTSLSTCLPVVGAAGSGHRGPTSVWSLHFYHLFCFCLMTTAQPHLNYTYHF
uniref:uncharacterized protein LOC118519187 n=1 Tax=Halichoerus grypus TaxID=9711 RepID=UPI001658EB0D|nr:uncharacterized protein LOC118519187 [Halichoerus grypus]